MTRVHCNRPDAHFGLLLAGVVMLAVAGGACRTPDATLLAGPPPTPTLVGKPDPQAVLRRSRAAMSELRSFVAHRTSTERRPSGELLIIATDYRFEPPDRHSLVSRGWIVGPTGDWIDGEDADAGEARQIGSSSWWRNSALDTEAEWSCRIDETRPDPMTYAPPLDAAFVGVEDTSLGTSLRFRSSAYGTETDYWIDPESYRVSRIEYARHRDQTFEIVTYRVGEFNTPVRIEPPGPCVPATVTRDSGE